MADVFRTTRSYCSKNPASRETAERSASRRRRRNQMRNSREAAASSLPPSEEEDIIGEDQQGMAPPGSQPPPPVEERTHIVPVVGAVAVAGRQRQMEDTVAVWMDLCYPLLNRGLPVHYFGVYDGHGGSHFSKLCEQKMHEILKEELVGAAPGEVGIRAAGPRGELLLPPSSPPGMIIDEGVLEETWKIVMNRVFARTEMVALHTCSCGSDGFQCRCDRSSLSYSGTTAVAVVLTEDHLIVGNCGDSRAILYRADRFIPLTLDHKPDRADEKARIEASGGHVLNTDTARVEGILAMSRAIGDVFLKPHVISKPDVSFTRRVEEDEFVIIASDGMWDVIPNEMAVRVAHQCLGESPSGCRLPNVDVLSTTASFPCRSASAASLLTRLALARSSLDNISVVVVDLKGGRSTGA